MATNTHQHFFRLWVSPTPHVLLREEKSFERQPSSATPFAGSLWIGALVKIQHIKQKGLGTAGSLSEGRFGDLWMGGEPSV